MSILPQIVANSLIVGALYTLLALGFNLIFGATKFFNLAHGVVAAVGGYAVFFLTKQLGLPAWLGIAAGITLAGLAGYLSDKLVYAPMRRRKASNMILLVASLGIFTALQALLAILFTSQFQVLTVSDGTAPYHVAGAVLTQVQLILILTSIVVTAALLVVLAKTRFGRGVRAISDDREMAEIVGINTGRIITVVFFIGSALAGLAGILVGYDTGIEPVMGLNLLLKGVIAAIVGGVGSVYGSIIGGFVLGFVENFGIWKISGEWKDAIAFVLLIGFLIFRPQGIIKR